MGLSSIAFNFVNWGATAAEAYMETLNCFEYEDPIRTDLAEREYFYKMPAWIRALNIPNMY